MDLYKYDKESTGIFIQIGAGAGDLDKTVNCRDGFTEFIKKLPRERIKKIILVEPNPLNIPFLKECWKDYPEANIYEIGIVPKAYQGNTIEFYYDPFDGTNFQVASIKKTHIEKHYGSDCKIEKFDIGVRDIETFLHLWTFKTPIFTELKKSKNVESIMMVLLFPLLFWLLKR